MKKLIIALFVIVLTALPARAIAPMQPLTMIKSDSVASQVLAQLNLVTFSISWNATTSARYAFVFDGTAQPGSGSVTNCSTSHVTGCALWCRYMVNSGTAPSTDWAFWGDTPLAAKFGLVIAVSTGAGCGTFTADGAAANTIVSMVY